MEHNMTHDPMDMSMRDMGKMLEGKTGDALNKAFLEGMIPHHEWAVEMAKYLASSNKPELVKLGGEIIVAQTREIEQMKKWMVEWGYTTTRKFEYWNTQSRRSDDARSLSRKCRNDGLWEISIIKKSLWKWRDFLL